MGEAIIGLIPGLVISRRAFVTRGLALDGDHVIQLERAHQLGLDRWGFAHGDTALDGTPEGARGRRDHWVLRKRGRSNPNKRSSGQDATAQSKQLTSRYFRLFHFPFPIHHYPKNRLLSRRVCYADDQQRNGITDTP